MLYSCTCIWQQCWRQRVKMHLSRFRRDGLMTAGWWSGSGSGLPVEADCWVLKVVFTQLASTSFDEDDVDELNASASAAPSPTVLASVYDAASPATCGRRTMASLSGSWNTTAGVTNKQTALTFHVHCCHIGTAIKHPVPDRVKPSFVIVDILISPERQSIIVSHSHHYSDATTSLRRCYSC